MKIAVSSTGEGLDVQASQIFGRCEFFVIVEVQDGKIVGAETIPNTAIAQRGGAGISASELVANKGVKAVISSALGPRAFGVLQQLGIECFVGIEGTVRENVEKFLKKELSKMDAATGQMGANKE